MKLFYSDDYSVFSSTDRADADRRRPRLHRLLGAAVDLQLASGRSRKQAQVTLLKADDASYRVHATS